jgi:nucleoside-diphosphate-sugar epimerase
MRIGISGWNGFIARKLRGADDIEWTKDTTNIDYYIHMGSPVFTEQAIPKESGRIMHSYVKESMELFDSISCPIIFASSTGVDDIRLDHEGSTSYNLSKLFLENYLINSGDEYLILRIGTIYSNNKNDVEVMKPDRIQPRVLRGELNGIPFKDLYLDIDVFLNTTLDSIGQTGILEYKLEEKTIIDLRKVQ